MKTKNLSIALLSMLMFSGVLMTTVTAKSWPSLPPGTVTLGISNQTPWTFPWDVVLSNVPAGFDVSNGAYTGWCVDVTHFIDRSLTYPVKLYSSLSPPVPVKGYPWSMINYILNHEDAGTPADVQDAIWYFVNGGAWYTWAISHTHTAEAELIVDDAIAYGAGYTPGPGDILAIICLPQPFTSQMLVIELQVPLLPGMGKVTGGGQCIIGDNKEIPSGSFGFNAMWFSRDPTPKGEINYVDHITGQHVHVHDLTYLVVWEPNPPEELPNQPYPMMKAKFGGLDVYSKLKVDVYVEDHGEPGKNDKFLIFLDGKYLGGSGDYFGSLLINDPILAGNIQIHKPPK
jgi:hypothetical protein